MDALKVCVTGAAGQITYSLLYSIARGDVFGNQQPITLHLLDISSMMGVLEGVVMELTDCALPNLRDVIPTSDPAVAFKDIDVAILVGAMPRREGMERKDLLKANINIFKAQGQALDQCAKKSVKIVVVGNPANTNCYICRKYAPSIPDANFSCLTRLDQNRAAAQVANRLKIGSEEVFNVIIWGNHSSTQFPDVRHASAIVNGQNKPVVDLVADDHWLHNGFIETVQKRGAAVIAARKLSSAMSASKAICDHMKDWWQGTKMGRWVSMGIVSDGSYDVDKGIIFSFPVTICNGVPKIVQGLECNEFSKAKIKVTLDELIEEKNAALQVAQD